VTFEHWAFITRERLRQRALGALSRLADYHERRRNYEQARLASIRQLELDPLREETHRQLMRVLAQSGERSAALEQYHHCRRLLADELGVEPELETQALYHRLRDTSALATGASPATQTAQPQSSLFQTPALWRRLPAQTTSFVGREPELAELVELLVNPACRLITLVGPGGIGKTRLALEAATAHAEMFAHGVVFVPLAGLASADFLISAIAAALDLPLQGKQDPYDQLIAYLREQELLLVLDNFEEFVPAAALLTDILRQARNLTFLVTSRERLALQAEWVFDLAGLAYPPNELAGDIGAYSAVQLFLQRVRQVNRHFAPAAPDLRTIAAFCRLVEGMPLAIELAAAAEQERPSTIVAVEITHRLRDLATSFHDVPQRHRSMAAVFEHSWQLLSEAQRSAFCQLAVFRGGFSDEAALKVAGAERAVLVALVGKSLVRVNPAGRYDMHELVRQLAYEKLQEYNTAAHMHSRHLAYYMTLGETVEPLLQSAEQAAWLDRLEVEHNNLRAALGWAFDCTSDVEAGLRLTGALRWFWHKRHMNEGLRWLAQGLARPEALQPTLGRAKVLLTAGLLRWEQGDDEPALALLNESLALFRALEDRTGIAWSLIGLGRVIYSRGERERAVALYDESLRLHRALNDKAGIAWSLIGLGHAVYALGDYARAETLLEESLALNRELAHIGNMGWALTHLAHVTQARGDCERAAKLYEESLALQREQGSDLSIAWALVHSGHVLQYWGDWEQATTRYQEGLDLFQKLEAKGGIAAALCGLGNLARYQGAYDQARILLEQSLVMNQEVGHRDHCAWVLHNLGQLALVQQQFVQAHELAVEQA
jgi:predicted ATPase